MNKERLERAYCALEGLSVGDGFGERWFYTPPELRFGLIQTRAMPAPPWDYTDDTQMALSIVATLRQHGAIHQDELAKSFLHHYEPARKYGAAVRGLFMQFEKGIPWKQAAQNLFDGQGSYGNGAAMRIAPLGAYFAYDLTKAAEQAKLASEITHAHPEGIAGGIAIAVAAAAAWQARQAEYRPSRREFISTILNCIPPSEVYSKVRQARDIPPDPHFFGTVSLLGNGSQISAQDTVALCLWVAGEYLDDYEMALWTMVKAGGDIDTNCAIVGGIVASYVGWDGIPKTWRSHRETLPTWVYRD